MVPTFRLGGKHAAPSLDNRPLILCLVQPVLALNQEEVPAIYSNILIQDGQPVVRVPGGILRLDPNQSTPDYSVKMLRGNPAGSDTGFIFSFTDPAVSASLAGGTLFYSLWDPMESRYPMPHYRFDSPIDAQGQARVDMSNLYGRFDLSGWEASGKGILYYRVTNARNAIIYEGKFFFTASPFRALENIKIRTLLVFLAVSSVATPVT